MIATIVSSPTFPAFIFASVILAYGRYRSAATCIGLGVYAAFGNPRSAK
jgi:hypothetical protein